MASDAVDVVHELIEEVRAAATTPILGIGVGTPGIVDQTGTIRWAVRLDWQDLPLAQILTERHGLPTVVANDSRAAAFATYLFQGDDRPPNLVVIKVGRGIGAGMVLRDQLFGGDGEAAGEIGHVVVDPDGDACHCGRYGCLETVASAPAVLKASGATSLEDLAARAAAGDDHRPRRGPDRRAGRSAARSPTSSARSTSARSRSSAPSPPSASRGSRPIRDEAAGRSLAATGRETSIEDGGTGEDVTLLGACALLLDPRARSDGAPMTDDRLDAMTTTTATTPTTATYRVPSPASISAAPRSPRSSSTPTAPSSVAPPTPPPWVTRAAPFRPSRPASTRPSPTPACRATDLVAIGVGVPGRVDPARGHVTLAVNLGWTDFALRDALELELGRPVVIENDVRAAAIGLHERGVVGASSDLAYLAVGTGIAAGVVLDGRLHRGARGLAGEIGHAIVELDGPRCVCGQRGCLEAFASGPSIARRAERVFGERRLRCRRRGRPGRRSTSSMTSVGRLAWAIHTLVMTYDVQRVVVGGGVSHAGPSFEAPLRRELARLRAASDLAGELLPADIVDVLPPEAEAGAWGAVAVARTSQQGSEVVSHA